MSGQVKPSQVVSGQVHHQFGTLPSLLPHVECLPLPCIEELPPLTTSPRAKLGCFSWGALRFWAHPDGVDWAIRRRRDAHRRPDMPSMWGIVMHRARVG